MQVKVVDIKPCNHPRIKAVATIELVGAAKICGIKLVQGDHGVYCVPPNQSYMENGLRKWTNVLTFERELWKQIQNSILKRYEELKNDGQRESQAFSESF